jgi:hypothetical protein
MDIYKRNTPDARQDLTKYRKAKIFLFMRGTPKQFLLHQNTPKISYRIFIDVTNDRGLVSR